MSRRLVRCRHPRDTAMPCAHCSRWTCLDCHHGTYHLTACPETRRRETRNR